MRLSTMNETTSDQQHQVLTIVVHKLLLRDVYVNVNYVDIEQNRKESIKSK